MRYIKIIFYAIYDFFRWSEVKYFQNYNTFKNKRKLFFDSNVAGVAFYDNKPKDFILTKEHINFLQNDLKNQKYKGTFKANTSGGSTGQSAIFLQDSTYDRYVSLSIRYYFQKIIGIDIRLIKKVILWGSEHDIKSWQFSLRKRIISFVTGNKFFNSFNMDDELCSDICEYIQKYNVKYLRGYGSSLEYLCDYCLNRKIEISLDYVVSSAEKLSSERIQKLKATFGCEVLDIYGSREAGMLAGRCLEGNYHFIDFNHHVDFEPTEDENVHNVLVSTLNNAVMPLKRYRIGDQVRNVIADCACGHPGVVVGEIFGRISDNFVRNDGSIIHGEFFTHLMYGETRVERFQFVQETPTEIYLSISVSSGVNAVDLIDELKAKLRPIVNKAMRADVDFCVFENKFLDNKHGKKLYTMSKVKSNES